MLDTFSERPVGLAFLPHGEAWAALWSSLRPLTVEQGQAKTYEEWGAPGVSVTRWQMTTMGLATILYENATGSGKVLTEEMGFQLSNLELLAGEGQDYGAPAESQDALKVELRPGESRLVVLRQVDSRASFGLGYSRSFSLAEA